MILSALAVAGIGSCLRVKRTQIVRFVHEKRVDLLSAVTPDTQEVSRCGAAIGSGARAPPSLCDERP